MSFGTVQYSRVLVSLTALVACSAGSAPAQRTPSTQVNTSPATPSVMSAPKPLPASPSAAVTANVPSAAAEPNLQDELLRSPDRQHAKTPEAVQTELDHMAKSYEPLPALRRLPDFLSVNAALALFPEEGERPSIRDAIHAQLDGESGQAALRGTYLDDDAQLFVLWIAGNLTQVLAVYDGERLSGRATISRGQVMLGELFAEADGARREILIERISSMSVCCLPSSLDVYRVSKRGALSLTLTFPKSHKQVGPGVFWTFMNHFEFDEDRVVVSRVFPEDGETYELLYDKRTRRYLPTRKTAELLESEREQSQSFEP